MRTGLVCVIALLLAPSTMASDGGAGDEGSSPETDIVVLDPLSASRGPDPLYEGDALLRALLARSTPCLGCDARALPERRNAGIDLLRYLLWPATPPQPDEATRMAFEVKLQDSPDLEYLRP